MRNPVSPIDGRRRDAEEERRLNAVIASVLGSAAGREVMDYLRSITINVAAGPEVTDAYLRHLEGQRFIVGLIQNRIDLGHKDKRHVTPHVAQGDSEDQ